MSWFALTAVDEAMDATREFLFPVERARWVRLAVIALFVGGGGTAFNWAQEIPLEPIPTEPAPPTGGLVSGVDTLALGLLLAIGLLALVFLVAGPVMRFVFLDALRTDEVRIRSRFRARFWFGLRLLLFSIGAGVLLVTVLATLFVAVTSGGIALADQVALGPAGSLLGLLGLLAAIVVGLLALVGVAAFFHFTTAFVAPTMVATDSGVVAAWGRFYRVLRAEIWQFVAYFFARLVLGVATAIIATLVTLLLGVVIALPALLVGGGVAVAFGGLSAALQSTAGAVALGALALVAVVAYLVLVWFPLRISLLTFYTTYELSMLGAVDDRLAIMASFGEDGDGHEAPDTADDGDRPSAPAVAPTSDDTDVSTAADEDDSGPPDEPDAPEEAGGFEFGVVEGSGEDDEPAGEPGDAAESPTDDDTDPSGGGDDAEGSTDDDGDGSADGESDGSADGDSDDSANDDGDDEDDFSTPYWRD